MKILDRGTVFPSRPGTDCQSCAFPQATVLPGGRWLAACRAACTKGGKEGQHVLLARSDDREYATSRWEHYQKTVRPSEEK